MKIFSSSQGGQVQPEFYYYAVFDGHGGTRHMGLHHVSDYLVKHLHLNLIGGFKSRFVDRSNVDMMTQAIKDIFVETDRQMQKRSIYGSTAVVVLKDVIRNRLYIINLGDSRAIVYKRNTGTIVTATVDHEPGNATELARIERGGGYVMYGRVNGSLMVSRAFGDFELKSNRNVPYDPVDGLVSAIPDVMVLPNDETYGLILTSDAPFERDAFNNESLVQLVRNKTEGTDNLMEAAQKTVEGILSTEPITTDDITILLA